MAYVHDLTVKTDRHGRRIAYRMRLDETSGRVEDKAVALSFYNSSGLFTPFPPLFSTCV
jgi:hypothetical protein